jgi:hypothetical protein
MEEQSNLDPSTAKRIGNEYRSVAKDKQLSISLKHRHSRPSYFATCTHPKGLSSPKKKIQKGCKLASPSGQQHLTLCDVSEQH